MRQIKYGFYGEDDAHKIFLHNYLQQINNETVSFERDEEFCDRFRANNKKQVDTKFAFVAREGLSNYQHDIFFVGRDIDSHQKEQFNIRRKHFADENIQNLVLMLPVQCIEHWIWHLKHHQDNPRSTKNVSLHMHPNKVAKREVYGYDDPPNAISNPIVDNLSSKFDVNWLESRSDSFRHFHYQVKTFINRLP